jgi:hypothetical protein
MLQNFNYNGQIIQRRGDGFISLTQMCYANGKRLDVFMKAKKTQEYIKQLANSLQMVVVQSEEGVKGGTWGHPSLAINLARWISPEFAVWCDAHIFNLMSTGSTSLNIDPMEEMRLKLELARLENDKTQAELKLLQIRQYVATALPEPVQQKILNYQVVEKVEYRDRVLVGDDLVNDGSTITKTELCKHYGFITKSGSPDFRKLNKHLESLNIPECAWKSQTSIRENKELLREYLPALDKMILDDSRQLWFGE